MNSRIAIGSLTAILLSYSLQAQMQPIEARHEAAPIVGTIQGKIQGEWKQVALGGSTQANWLSTDSKSEGTVQLPSGAHLRMAPDTVVHVQASGANSGSIQLVQGRLMVSVPEDGKTTLRCATPQGVVQCSAGQNVVEASEGRTSLEVMDGSANLSSDRLASPQLGKLGKNAQGLPGIRLEASGDAPPEFLAANASMELAQVNLAHSPEPTYIGTIQSIEYAPGTTNPVSITLKLEDGTLRQVNLPPGARVIVEDSGDIHVDTGDPGDIAELKVGDQVKVYTALDDVEKAVVIEVPDEAFPVGAALGAAGTLALLSQVVLNDNTNTQGATPASP